MRRGATAAVLVAVLGLALLVPLLGNYYIHVFALVLTNVILAASLRPSLMCGQLNIGHSAFMCLGAYTSALLAKHHALPFELSLLSGALLATVVLRAPGIPHPTAVRYAWADNPDVNLINRAGFPAVPFRTDAP